MNVEQDGLSYAITEKLMVQFVEEKEKYIMDVVVDHLSNNAPEYEVVEISKDKLRRIVELGMMAYQAEQAGYWPNANTVKINAAPINPTTKEG